MYKALGGAPRPEQTSPLGQLLTPRKTDYPKVSDLNQVQKIVPPEILRKI